MTVPFVVGCRRRIEGYVRDLAAGVATAIDLTGKTVKLRARINGGTGKAWTASIDPDQTNYRGRYYYDLAALDLDAAGTLELQMEVVDGGRSYFSDIVSYEVKPQL